MLTADVQGKSSKDSLMHLFDKSPAMAATTNTERTAAATTTTDTTAAAPTAITTTTEMTAAAPSTAETSTTTAAASPVKTKLSQKFNIWSPNKQKLAMEFVCDIDTPLKVPLMRALVKGSTFSIERHNNQSKKFVHIPQCSSEASAMSQVTKYKFIQGIVGMLGAGAKQVAGSWSKGALWLCRGLADIFSAEFGQTAARAGITCITRMSAEATGAMWTDAKLTKRKSRKISAHLLDWFKKAVTATKEPYVNAFGTRPQVKRKYDSLQLTSEKGRSSWQMTSRKADV
jgi:hypothetical protein